MVANVNREVQPGKALGEEMRFQIAVLMLVTACTPRTRSEAPPAQPTTPAARPLSYTTPAPPTLTYEFADSSVSDIQAGPAGAIRVSTGMRGTAEMKFEPNGSNQKVTITFPQFSGSFSNSAGGGVVNATQTDIRGPLILMVTQRGAVTLDSRPEVTQAFRSVAGADNEFRRLFVRLPARLVRPGATWTDSIPGEETNEGLTTRHNSVVRSTYVRDTVLAGRTLNVISSESDRTLQVTGTTQGVEIVQRLRGTSNTVTLWDPERRAIFSRTESSQLTGTFDLPAMSMTNLPITATGRSVQQLRQ
ncbi:MAG: hypothetical protein ACRENP_11295 [Longimicrobiales bacterium]